ncbi:MAG: TonB-dependent receptor plug domain-containing protein [bacterium]
MLAKTSVLLWCLISFLILVNPLASQETRPTDSDSTSRVKLDTTRKIAADFSEPWQVHATETAELIAEDVGDYVQLFPNIQSLDLGSLGQFSPLSFRGASPQQAAILFDGFEWVEPIGGFLNPTNIPINLIDNLQFRGVGAFENTGVLGPAGVLQIQTYDFQSARPYSKVLFRAGDWGYSDLGVIFGLPVSNKSRFVISGNRQELDGFEINRKHANSRILTRFSVQPRANLSLIYTGFINKDDVKVPAPLAPDLLPRLTAPKRKEKRFDQMLHIKWEDGNDNGKRFDGRIIFSKIRQRTFDDSLLFNIRDLTLSLNARYQLAVGAHTLIAGGEIRLDDFESLKISPQSDQKVKLFVQDAFQIASKAALELQAQVEKHSDHAAVLNWSARVNYGLAENGQLWLGWQQSRRYPSFVERFWPTLLFRGNPALAAEKVMNFELGYQMQNSKKMVLQASVFARRTRNWITAAALDSSIKLFNAVNLGVRTLAGIEAKFNWNFYRTGKFGAIASYLKVKETAREKRLRVPEINFYSYFEIGRNFFEEYVFIKLRLVNRIYGTRWGPFYSFGASFPTMAKRDLNVLFDGQLTFQFSDARLLISMENITDARYQLVPGFFMPPKTLRFGIEWEFWD